MYLDHPDQNTCSGRIRQIDRIHTPVGQTNRKKIKKNDSIAHN